MNLKKLKNNTMLGKISFSISILILLWILEASFHDIIFPIDFDNPNSGFQGFYNQCKPIISVIIILLALVNFILGIITLFQKESNKKIAIITILLCGLIAVPFLIAFIRGFTGGFIRGIII